MKSDTALVGTYSRVELDPETTVYLDLAVVIYPGYSEYYLSLGLNYSLEHACINEILSLFSNRLECLENLGNGLYEFGLAGISLFNSFEQFLKILIC